MGLVLISVLRNQFSFSTEYVNGYVARLTATTGDSPTSCQSHIERKDGDCTNQRYWTVSRGWSMQLLTRRSFSLPKLLGNWIGNISGHSPVSFQILKKVARQQLTQNKQNKQYKNNSGKEREKGFGEESRIEKKPPLDLKNLFHKETFSTVIRKAFQN